MSEEVQITVVFVVLGIGSWYAVSQVTDSTVVQLAVLIAVGVLAPTVINEHGQA